MDIIITIITYLKEIGPFVPISLAFIESLLPVLPLALIVNLNIQLDGIMIGIIYSYIGSLLGSILVYLFFNYLSNTCLRTKIVKIKGVNTFLNKLETISTFYLIILLSTLIVPSSLVNISIALSNYPRSKFLLVLCISKFISISIMGIGGTAIIMRPYTIIIIAIILIVHWYYKRYINKELV
ncbi:MAG: VTT domain-containing protein [Erysipelotrichaceae bacterium]